MAESDGYAALALSGGGIRSATFALGVLQAFAKAGHLKRFDYLSTVSGGGYIGTSLSWLLAQRSEARAEEKLGLDAENFPFGTDDPGEARTEDSPPLLRYLREHGNYLTPGNGLSFLSAAAVVLRSLLANLVVWIPITIVLFVCFARLDGFPPAAFSLPDAICCEQCGDNDVCVDEAVLSPANWPLDSLTPVLTCLAALFIIGCAAYSLFTAVPGFRPTRYSLRRFVERWSGTGLGVAAMVGAVASLPKVAEMLGDTLTGAGGIGALILGGASGVFSFFQAGQKSGKVPLGALATVGAILLLYGVLLLGYWGSLHYVVATDDETRWGLAAAFVVALLVGFFVNLNHIGLHRFYRDRLMETYLPPVETVIDGNETFTGASPAADGYPLSKLAADGGAGPYHLVNANVVLVDSKKPRYRFRGGDSFTLSPLYCGSDATGWLPTKEFMNDGITLPTAMAISGAAAHPNTGIGGTSLMRSKAVSLLMALLNIRLGYWVRNPRCWRRKFFRTPSHFKAMVYEVGPFFYREDRRHLQISDGGHFDNLGIYELVRRKARLIVAVDAGADPNFDFVDLQIASRRIAEDFGARITFDDDNRLEMLMPSSEPGYPKGVKYSKKGFLLGSVVYREGPPATLLYIKTTMIEEPDLGLRVKGYKGANPTFPDQTTADQFFDESQFEAYRTLGYRIGETVNETLTALRSLAGTS